MRITPISLYTTCAVILQVQVNSQSINCGLARPSLDRLAPPDSTFQDVTIVGMNDNGVIQGLSIDITKVWQDEDPDALELPGVPDPANFPNIFQFFIDFFVNLFFGWLFGSSDSSSSDEDSVRRHLADAVIDGKIAALQKERDANGDGRVYTISFLARDINNNSCTGEVKVCVPRGGQCVDGGRLFNSVL